MFEAILRCTFLFVENKGNCVCVFPFSKPDTVLTVVANLSVKEQLLSIPRYQKGPLKFTDFAIFSFAQDGSQSALNYKAGGVLDDTN